MKKLYTIGFTKKSAEVFFDILQKNQIDLIADVRLNNKGQLAGYTKEKDFRYFLSLFKVDFVHLIDFAPTRELRNKYHADWNFDRYRTGYLDLLQSRESVKKLNQYFWDHNNICLLCSEPAAQKCHRRLAAEKIAEKNHDLTISHL